MLKQREILVVILEGSMRRGFTNRRCPKCNGNLFVDHDSYAGSEEDYRSWYEWCLQCGYTRYLKPASVSAEDFEVIPVIKESAII